MERGTSVRSSEGELKQSAHKAVAVVSGRARCVPRREKVASPLVLIKDLSLLHIEELP